MKFATPLLKGKFLRRYKRFFADIELDRGETVTAHTPNTGAMLTCREPGALAYVSTNDNPKRKLKYTWELVRSGETLVGVNTLLANRLAEEAILAGKIPELAGYGPLRREVRYGQNSRVDFLLGGNPLGENRLGENRAEENKGSPLCYVEVKNVSMGRGGIASFPDAVSARAAKHMAELAAQVRAGNHAAVLLVVQRMDCDVFEPADDIDPVYGAALRKAAAAGVRVLAWRADVSPEGIELAAPLPVRL